MSLQGAHFAGRYPRQYLKWIIGSLIVLTLFLLLFQTNYLVAIYFYITILSILIISIPFALIFDKRKREREYIKQEKFVEQEQILVKEKMKRNVDLYLDKSKCMSCLKPVNNEADYCPKCGFKLTK